MRKSRLLNEVHTRASLSLSRRRQQQHSLRRPLGNYLILSLSRSFAHSPASFDSFSLFNAGEAGLNQSESEERVRGKKQAIFPAFPAAACCVHRMLTCQSYWTDRCILISSAFFSSSSPNLLRHSRLNTLRCVEREGEGIREGGDRHHQRVQHQ